VGTDKSFFKEDEKAADRVRDIYSEKAGALDQADDAEIDLSSYAPQIWKDAIGRDPLRESRIEQMPNVVFSAKRHDLAEGEPTGSLVYLRNAHEEDVMAWVDEDGNTVSESQLDILRSAACGPDTPAAPRGDGLHERVSTAAQRLRDQQVAGVQLGSHLGARHKVYNHMKEYAEHEKGTIMVNDEFNAAIHDIYTYTLQEPAKKAAQQAVALPDRGRVPDRLGLADAPGGQAERHRGRREAEHRAAHHMLDGACGGGTMNCPRLLRIRKGI